MRRQRRCLVWRRVFSIFIRPTARRAACTRPWLDEKRKRTKRTCYTTEWEGKNTFRSGRPCLAVRLHTRKAYAVTRRVIKFFFVMSKMSLNHENAPVDRDLNASFLFCRACPGRLLLVECPREERRPTPIFGATISATDVLLSKQTQSTAARLAVRRRRQDHFAPFWKISRGPLDWDCSVLPIRCCLCYF